MCVCTVTNQLPSWYGLRYCKDVKLHQPTRCQDWVLLVLLLLLWWLCHYLCFPVQSCSSRLSFCVAIHCIDLMSHLCTAMHQWLIHLISPCVRQYFRKLASHMWPMLQVIYNWYWKFSGFLPDLPIVYCSILLIRIISRIGRALAELVERWPNW